MAILPHNRMNMKILREKKKNKYNFLFVNEKLFSGSSIVCSGLSVELRQQFSYKYSTESRPGLLFSNFNTFHFSKQRIVHFKKLNVEFDLQAFEEEQVYLTFSPAF